MNIKKSIITSGKATTENTCTTFGIHKWNKKNGLTLKKSNFRFLTCFKSAIIRFIPVHQPSRQRHNLYPSTVFHQTDASNVFTGHDIDCINIVCNWKIARNRLLQLCTARLFIEHSINFRLNGKHWRAVQLRYSICRNLLRQNAYRRLRRRVLSQC